MPTGGREQRAVPMISYEKVADAIDWLSKAFGFREKDNERYTEPDGTVSHAELELDGAVVMLGWPGPAYRSPARHQEVCEYAREWLSMPYVVDGALVYVDDVDRHYEQTRAAGARFFWSSRTSPTDAATTPPMPRVTGGCSCRLPQDRRRHAG